MTATAGPGMAVRILGTGEYRPSLTVTSDALDARWNKAAGWTQRHSGIQARRYAAEHETSSVMGAAAARQALSEAGLRPNDLDCIVSACSVMEQPIPCTAALIQRELGLGDSGIPAFDINATCLGFPVALDLMATAIAAGRHRHVLIVSSEIASAGLPPDAPATAMLFGDGAGAAVLGSADGHAGSRVLASHFATYGDGAEHCRVRAGGTRLRVHDDDEGFRQGAVFEMDGRATYRMAAARLPMFLEQLLQRAHVHRRELAAIVPHQASDKALTHLQTLLELPDGMLVRTLPDRGNQMAASLPVALHEGMRSGRLRRGDVVALIGSGAGLSFGGCVLRL